MKSKVTGCLLFGLAFLLTLTISARPDGSDQDDRDQQECRDVEHNAKTPLEAIGAIGMAVRSSVVTWSITQRLRCKPLA